MIERFTAISRAKVNLALQVLYKRGDGFHEIETVFQSVDLRDELDVQLRNDGEILITCTDPDIPSGESNLCHKALRLMRRFAGKGLGATVHIEKRIPHSAGLGGGSSNAAAMILAVNAGCDLGLPIDTLESVALEIGSDVPFMLHGGTMLGRGRGERLSRLESLKRCYFLIVKPPVNISSRWVYENINFRLTKNRYRFNLKRLNTVLARFPKVALSFKNDLENVVCPAFPLIGGLLDQLLSCDPRFASMSGSGSALFAVFDSEAKASGLAERFSIKGCFTSVVEPSPRAIDLRPS
ncbi:MAG: 4-(cytidine 5'-diphospho)-2-C-methyl-D-erythritol kinase [Candidatus Latescibacteria bacterium]|nr:4-(cytidine 5'-diphospho)-2-C-methyl-D-erythritol kinase [Candidatus Latescibacterota bacterium]NIM21125.1 4-(cytidine 5'-diphospho)-2-C-methyl-D-erythritol kinase [Candidatus Latescibacterota bacterium]NIM65260.1 4-(cytidine 5'-diphospho)-2-C-methyl-D-erythritol kinase [Candidatus Latescibacterota bacterium]NIO01775.1 4-(cytidine 5'-diphospho)-2-C-methyl-D-erythritol kinase [Candidatus Latescibacterota bacterium]NIO28292.1 4-(cytidine 5'-diphospho)-2-C-methyl-D-erythritol kinase [Candidatus